MSSSAPGSRRSYSVLLARLFWPTAFLLAATIGFVFSTIIWSSRNANDEAAERQRAQIAAAIEQRLQDLQAQLSQAFKQAVAVAAQGSVSPLVVAERAADRTSPLFDAMGAVWIGDDRTVARSGLTGAVESRNAYRIADALLPSLLDAAEAKLNGQTPSSAQESLTGGLTRLAFVDGAVYGVVASPARVPNADGYLLAIGLRRFEDGGLRRIAALHGLRDFALAAGPLPPGAIGLQFESDGPSAHAHATWTPNRPGDAMLDRLIPLTLIGAIVTFVMFAFIMSHVRRIAQDLASTQERAQALVGRDPLSGLPNRFLFAERLDQELSRIARTGEGLAVMFLDLDRFKEVNDTFGHQAGDHLIKEVAGRLSRLLRGADTLARFGGDEFAIIQTVVRSRADAETLARRILAELTHPFEIAGASITIGVSIGVALAPDNGLDREPLMRLADTALYQSKGGGRNRYTFFASEMDEAIRMRKIVEDDLREAIVSDKLALHYQPLYSADGERIVALEALVRWPHPEQGMISPARFIPMAEERGLIVPLGDWVLRRACEDGKRWPGVRMAVNVSPIQFRHRDFVQRVTQTLKATGFDASRLELELTEGVVVEDADAAEAAMMDLRALGVHLALDDFGTGYSSLIYLRRFAFDKIKIDRSFLESMEATGESAILVHSIVHLGRALGLTVTAEGVETREQHRFLQALGCHELQGYLFSKPVPADEIDILMNKGRGVAASAA